MLLPVRAVMGFSIALWIELRIYTLAPEILHIASISSDL